MTKKIFLLFIILSSINASHVGAMRKAAVSAALASSAAGLAWMGSPYFSQQEANEKVASELEKGKMSPDIHGYLEEITKSLTPSGKNVIFTYHDPTVQKASEAFVFQVPGKNIISFPYDSRSIWRMSPEEGDAPEFIRLGAAPDFPHNLAHELKHIIEDDNLRGHQWRKKIQLGALGLSGLSLVGSIQNIFRPLSVRMGQLGLAVSPFYYFSTKFIEAYQDRQKEMIAENFAIQHSTDEHLHEFYNKFKYMAIYSNRYAYTYELERFNKGDIDWAHFYMALTHPTAKDIYNMVVTEMKKRNIKPINSDNRAVPEIFSIQHATPQELQHLYDEYKFFANYTNLKLYKIMFDEAARNNTKESWLNLYLNFNEFTGRDIYDMIIGEMRRRGIKVDL